MNTKIARPTMRARHGYASEVRLLVGAYRVQRLMQDHFIIAYAAGNKEAKAGRAKAEAEMARIKARLQQITSGTLPDFIV